MHYSTHKSLVKTGLLSGLCDLFKGTAIFSRPSHVELLQIYSSRCQTPPDHVYRIAAKINGLYWSTWKWKEVTRHYLDNQLECDDGACALAHYRNGTDEDRKDHFGTVLEITAQ